MPAPQIDVFAALANPVRREILSQLKKGPSAVNALAQADLDCDSGQVCGPSTGELGYSYCQPPASETP